MMNDEGKTGSEETRKSGRAEKDRRQAGKGATFVFCVFAYSCVLWACFDTWVITINCQLLITNG